MECNYEIHDKEILAVIRGISEITEINLNSYVSFFFSFSYISYLSWESNMTRIWYFASVTVTCHIERLRKRFIVANIIIT